MPPLSSNAPIGVFDSGIGGLSVLRALREELPHERFVYLADSAHTPYGEKGDAFVRERSLAIARHLMSEHAIKLLVVACNTATAAAVHLLRSNLPDIALVGVEPALKPAAHCSRTHHVGVLATRGTIASARFGELLSRNSEHTHFSVQACDGLAHAIEQSTLEPLPAAASLEKTRALCARYMGALGPFGTRDGEMDTLVLGCTHYVFAEPLLRELAGPDIRIIETGAAVARQARRLLQERALLTDPAAQPHGGDVGLYTTAAPSALQAAAQRWLYFPISRCATVSLP
jgi:glutamate racemase